MAPQTQMRLATESGKPIPRRVAFTEAIVRQLAPKPGKRQTWYHDSKQRGLVLLVTPAGSKAYYLYRKMNGRPVRVRLGAADTTSVDQARKLAMRGHAQMNDGIDPQQAKRQQRLREASSISVGTLWQQYRTNWLNLKATPRTIISDVSRYNTCLATWKDRRIDKLTPDDCRQLHAKLGVERGAATADKALKLLRRMFGWANISPNPCGGKNIKWFVGKNQDQRDRYLTAAECKRFNKALEREPNDTIKDFVRALLLIGQRKSNTAAMRWDNLDLDSGVWRIPGRQHKTGNDTLIPLSAAAVAMLKERRARLPDDAEYVFPSQRADSTKPHITEARYALSRICERAKISDLHVHDLRRTLGVQQALAGASELVIGASLGHRDREATRRYSQIANLAVVRQSIERANAVIVGGKEAKKQK